MKRASLFMVVFSLFFLSSTSAFALPSSPLWIHDYAGNIGTYDIDTNTVNVIGNMGAVMTDIAFDPFGNLYGITYTGLYLIDVTNASST